jgi:peptide subunit release factor RF-3
MEIERQRGISISTSVLQFEYAGRRMNLLDTPATTTSARTRIEPSPPPDSAVMLIDSVKGVEPQTIKLFQVCRMRGVPITTFINKMDRLGRPPLELLDEIEKVLGIPCAPANWPIGSGPGFLGVYDRDRREVLRFERAAAASAWRRRGPATSTTRRCARVWANAATRRCGTRSTCSRWQAPRSTTTSSWPASCLPSSSAAR